MVRHRSKAKLLLCVNACHRMGCLVRARRERGVDLWKTGGVVQCCSGNCNASAEQCSGARRCASYGRAAQRWNNGRPQDGAMQRNNGGQYGDGR